MYILDRKWSDLSAAYQSARGLQARLETEFGRALRTGYKIKYRRELTEWQKKRRIFWTMAALAPLSVIGLCVASFYFREVACVIVYWALLVAIILVTLAVAGRQFIREAVAGRPVETKVDRVAFDLERRWWEQLAPTLTAAPVKKSKDVPPADFLSLVGRSLPAGGVCMPGLYTQDTLLVLAPSGMWLFETRSWAGTLRRQEGVWKQVVSGKRKQVSEVVLDPAPDEAWVRRRAALLQVLATLPQQYAWAGDHLQGGVVFTHPQAVPDKANLTGNSAPYGSAGAWLKRLHETLPVEGFTLELRLALLDALVQAENSALPGSAVPVSAVEAAEQVYRQAADEIRASVEGMVQGKG
jgi:hypothetical protein